MQNHFLDKIQKRLEMLPRAHSSMLFSVNAQENLCLYATYLVSQWSNQKMSISHTPLV